MNMVEKKALKGSEARSALTKANEAYTSCITKEFLQKFLAGDAVKVEDFCVKEREEMQTLDHSIYGKLSF